MASKKGFTQGLAFAVLYFFSFLVFALVFAIIGVLLYKGLPAITWEFLTKSPEDGMTKGGIFPAIVGTLALIVGSSLVSFPIGIMAGIFMNEYTYDNWLRKLIRMITNNLAGIPSIVFGLFGMSLFVNTLEFGVSLLAGSLTLGILVLPVIIRTTEESLKFVPNEFRTASYALGATKWQTIQKVVLPAAFPNIITGLILSISRISGETAPIMFTVAAYFLPKINIALNEQVMALPYHLYVVSTSGIDPESTSRIAFGTALVLTLIVLILNLLANWIRKSMSK